MLTTRTLGRKQPQLSLRFVLHQPFNSTHLQRGVQTLDITPPTIAVVSGARHTGLVLTLPTSPCMKSRHRCASRRPSETTSMPSAKLTTTNGVTQGDFITLALFSCIIKMGSKMALNNKDIRGISRGQCPNCWPIHIPLHCRRPFLVLYRDTS